ncbi:bifunctional folylpolyglutamate synthase/dihydrofolate synthase [Formicincola oecophyllae]|uniref:Dihydrofolate synthase/folylpolyglutamate synthase n=1 Tax=Formicincola oecophyllae TaxID=2558361 RepID=A0A4Y6U7E3_9PROT|nr:folylpolyglutamate synthase/dihydrofolate synthase family protein [Formicincola oecophyllae]QDH13323.1 bifunctional folylpolyglutamate synthase/dihydrofolate synthase [Formicincola oecophyllae]
MKAPHQPPASEPGCSPLATQLLERAGRSHHQVIDLGLERLKSLLARLGHPERAMPPAIHVAGTNGKGSTTAFMRAMVEGSGLRCHVMTSPHLLRLTERFVVGNHEVGEKELDATLTEIMEASKGSPVTPFELLTAAGFMLFARHPADLCLVEVGLGGRLDATNLLRDVRASVITPISLDHQDFLGNSVAQIAAEKAGIIRKGVPVVSAAQSPAAAQAIAQAARQAGTSLWREGVDFKAILQAGHMLYQDRLALPAVIPTAGQAEWFKLSLPQPALQGTHQVQNATVAVAALRAAGVRVTPQGWRGLGKAQWPARGQILKGSLAHILPEGWRLMVDGAHNEGGAQALAALLRQEGQPGMAVHLVCGLKNTKDASGYFKPLLPLANTLQAVAEPGQHQAQAPEAIVDAAQKAWASMAGTAAPPTISQAPTIRQALKNIRAQAQSGQPGLVVLCGSLYLAAIALRLDAQPA